jgi:hypothetical protein
MMSGIAWRGTKVTVAGQKEKRTDKVKLLKSFADLERKLYSPR